MNKNKSVRRPFNLYIVIIFIVILGGMFFIINGLVKPKTNARDPKASHSQVLYDRAQYLDYSTKNFTSSQKTGRTLLFFAATTWCSNCVELEKQIKTHISELPKDITILKVDYDNDRETKAKYAVTQQTTLVLLDGNGNEIKRWIGTGSFDDLMENIN